MITGLVILTGSGLSWVLETDDTYWIWHRYHHPNFLNRTNFEFLLMFILVLLGFGIMYDDKDNLKKIKSNLSIFMVFKRRSF